MNKQKLNTTIQLFLVIGLLIVANMFSGYFFKRFDLTAEKRYSLSNVSVNLVNDLPSRPLISIYFSGQMPTRYKMLEENFLTYLGELNIATDRAFDYEFIDPSENKELINEFYKNGFYPFQVSEQVGPTEKKNYLLLPYGMITYQGKKLVVNLVKGCIYNSYTGSLEIDVEKAIQNFEYTLVTSMYNFSREKSKLIGILTGHNEASPETYPDLMGSLQSYYTIKEVNVKSGEAISPSFEAIVVMRPDSAFTEREIYEIDQYVMRGGKVIWLMDNERIDFDIGRGQSTLTELRELGLDYYFMKQGVKINYDIVQDLYCDQIDLAANTPGFGSDISQRPWVFHPVVESFPDHPISRNMDRISLRFASSIDTNHIEGIRKEVILRTSKKSRTVQNSQFIDIDQYIQTPPPENLFSTGSKMTGIILSGKINSVYARREAPVDQFAPDAPTATFLPSNVDFDVPKVAVISDGEFGMGALYRGKRGNAPYDNRAFLMNLIDYMTGDNILTQIRSKDIQMRMLDARVIKGQESFIRWFNILTPILLIIIFGISRHFFRKRKYTKLSN